MDDFQTDMIYTEKKESWKAIVMDTIALLAIVALFAVMIWLVGIGAF